MTVSFAASFRPVGSPSDAPARTIRRDRSPAPPIPGRVRSNPCRDAGRVALGLPAQQQHPVRQREAGRGEENESAGQEIVHHALDDPRETRSIMAGSAADISSARLRASATPASRWSPAALLARSGDMQGSPRGRVAGRTRIQTGLLDLLRTHGLGQIRFARRCVVHVGSWSAKVTGRTGQRSGWSLLCCITEK